MATEPKFHFQEIREGSATLIVPAGNQVFYNPVQEMNRDMSIAVIRTWAALRRRELAEKELKRAARLGSAFSATGHVDGEQGSDHPLNGATSTDAVKNLQEQNQAEATADELVSQLPSTDAVKNLQEQNQAEATADELVSQLPSTDAVKNRQEQNQAEATADELVSQLPSTDAVKNRQEQNQAEATADELVSQLPSTGDGSAVHRFKILEALSASGLRSIRYAKEMGEIIDFIVANDLSPAAVESISRNTLHNGLTEDKIRPNCADAW